MNFRRLQQFHFTMYSIMNIITAFSILLQFHGILLILVLFILDFTYLVVLVVAILKSNLERIPKIRMCFKEKSVSPCWDGLSANVHMTNFLLTYVGPRQNQVRSHLGQVAHFSYEHAKFFKGVS